MKRWLPLFFLAVHGWAYSSLVVRPGVSGVMKVPAVAPFTSMGDYRIEFRIHDWTLSANNYIGYLSWGSTYQGDRYLQIDIGPSGEICAFDYGGDTMPWGQMSCANLTGHTDVIVRVQRFGSTNPSQPWAVGSFLLEAQDTLGSPIPSYCGSNPAAASGCPITVAVSRDWSRMAGYVGNPSTPTAFSLAWLKWFSATTLPGSRFSQESTPADLADWRFENNLNNAGTGGYKVSIGSFSAGPSYTASPSYAPTCVAGSPRVFRAGYPAQLDGTSAYPLNGSWLLTYLWQEMSGPTQVLWTGQNTAQPSIDQAIFGSYVFQLTVTDSGGQSTACTVKHSFVAADENNVAITGNPAVDTLLGPMISYGGNPWPWFDDRNKADAALIMKSLDSYYTASWVDLKGAGSVMVTTGSATATGSGTSFTTTFCQGPGNPTTPKQASGANAMLLVWYPDSSQEGYGLRSVPVVSCQSDSALTMSQAWNGLHDAADCGSGGCPYSYDDMSYHGRWTYPNGEGSNYYDVVAGLYALYYRTGVDDYLTYARLLADRFWKYRLDSGTLCYWGEGDRCGGSDGPRTKSVMGMVLRALDGKPEMWSGLERLVAYHSALLTDYYLPNHYSLDIREAAYAMQIVSYCAVYDPAPAARSGCKGTLSRMMNELWSRRQAPDGSWHQLYSDTNSWNWGGSATSVSLVNGSVNVVGSGTAWTTDQVGAATHIVFLPTSAPPVDIQAQEHDYYAATYVDGTHLTLDRPYAGASGTHGWMLGYSSTSAVGWGTQPFIQGILGLAFEFTAQALAETDAVNSTRAHSYNVSIAHWLRDYGFRPAMKGMQYFAGTVDCQPPISEAATWCTSGYNASQSRTLSAEALRSVVLAYAYSKDPDLLAFGDTLYNAMYAKPGTCPEGSSLCVPDGMYIDDLNDATGWYVTGTPNGNLWHKYFGQLFGIGAGADWPAVRIGGPQSPRRRPVRLGFDIQSVPGVASVRVTAIAPSGEASPTPCASSPCAVMIDGRQGGHLLRLEYLSPTGAVLASAESPVTQGR